MKKNETPLSPAVFTAFRLKPGDELLKGIREAVAPLNVSAAYIAGSVGSLSSASIRFAGRSNPELLRGTFEVVALGGTIDAGGEHLHICISDENGDVIGGHLSEGSIVRTTMEIVIGLLPALSFSREYCPLSTYDELKITAAGKGEEKYEE